MSWLQTTIVSKLYDDKILHEKKNAIWKKTTWVGGIGRDSRLTGAALVIWDMQLLVLLAVADVDALPWKPQLFRL